MENNNALSLENNPKRKGNILIIIGLCAFLVGLVFVITALGLIDLSATPYATINPSVAFAIWGFFTFGGLIALAGSALGIIGIIVKFLI